MHDEKDTSENVVREPLSASNGIDFTTIEALFFAYRDFTSDPDAILAQIGFGRAHHRVLHFVNRRPGLTVAELLDVLRITKQSLARVLKQLVDTGHIVQLAGSVDRRQRELYPTRTGRDLAKRLAEPQSRRIAGAFGTMSGAERAAVAAFLRRMVTDHQEEPPASAAPGAPDDTANGEGHG